MRKLSAHFINVTIIGTILFLVPALLLGQTQVMNANIFDYRDGMSQSTVKYITEDRFGNIWLSTDDGINIFNGKTFEKVIAKNEKNQTIRVGDVKQILWGTKTYLLTSNGDIFALNDTTYVFTKLVLAKPFEKISSLVEKDGLVYFSHSHGVSTFDKNNTIKTYIDTTFNLSAFFYNKNTAILQYLLDKSQLITISKKGFQKQNIDWQHFQKPTRLIKATFLDEKTIVLTSNQGIFFIENGRVTKSNALDVSHNAVVLKDKGAHLFLLQEDDFVIKKMLPDSANTIERYIPVFNKGTKRQLNYLYGFVDSKNDIWLGTDIGMIHIDQNNQFYRSDIFNIRQPMYNYKNSDTTYFAYTFDSVCLFDFKNNSIIQKAKSKKPRNFIFNKTIYFFDSTGLKDIAGNIAMTELNATILKNKIVCNEIIVYNDWLFFIWDKDKKVWLYDIKNKTTTTLIVKLYNNKENRFLTKTKQYGDELYFYSASSFFSYNIKTKEVVNHSKSSSLSAYIDHVFDFCEYNSHLYFAGYDVGLIDYDLKTKTVKLIDTKEDLPSKFFCAVEADSLGRLWIALNEGLFVYDLSKNSFTRAIDNRFGEFTSLLANYLIDNQLLFNSSENVLLIDAKKYQHQNSLRNFYIATIEYQTPNGVYNKIHNPKNIETEAGVNNLSFDIGIVDFYNNNLLNFSYKMDGIDAQYMPCKSYSVNYFNLSPGYYTFSLRDDISKAEKKVQIHIKPYWYQTLLFKTFALIALLALIIGFIVALFLRQKDRIEKKQAIQSAAYKQQFLANMSHELRTPINAILGFTDLLKKTDSKTESVNYIEAINTSGHNILRLVNDILDYSKIEAGKLDLENEPILLKKVVNDVYMISKVLADKKGLTFNNIFDEKINFYVKSDSYRLVQILLNLINNAIKYTSEGQVSIQVSLVQQDEKMALIEFMVADTGRGIPASKLETIFEGYTQSSVSDTRVYGGTGLGLTITKELVSLFDGNISVESKENFGSKFYVTIQFEKCEMPTSEKNTVSEVEMERDFYVLLAEDNKLNYMLLRKQLETIYKNIKIDHAIDGKEAIEFFNAKKYDLIIMDMFMPEMDGITATKTIRSNENTFKSKVPILAFTGNTTKEDMDKCYAAGMNDILIKPYKIDDLKAKINHLIL